MLLHLAFALATTAPPCPAGSAVVFSCPARKKHIAVCIDASTPPRFAQYRFGALATVATTPELVVPREVGEGFRPFVFARRDLISGTSTSLTFTVGDVGYEVYSQDGRDAGGGVNVTRAGKLVASIGCTGVIDEHWDKLEPHVRNEPAAPPPGGVAPGSDVGAGRTAPAAGTGAAPAACEAAALQWSLLLQRGAHGQMDGVQQSDIADALSAQCKQGWSADVVACFAARKAGCDEQLAGPQRAAAHDAIRAISPDALPAP